MKEGSKEGRKERKIKGRKGKEKERKKPTLIWQPCSQHYKGLTLFALTGSSNPQATSHSSYSLTKPLPHSWAPRFPLPVLLWPSSLFYIQNYVTLSFTLLENSGENSDLLGKQH